MSGVIDEAGTQWERCNACGEWVKFDDLAYGTVTQVMVDEMLASSIAWYEEHPEGRCDIRTRPELLPNTTKEYDLCPTCDERARP
jgi:hypothetical protein